MIQFTSQESNILLKKMETKTKLTGGAIGVLAIATIILSAGLVGQENVYACLDREIAMICDKLSSMNADGIHTRCYYFNENLNKSTYKTCSSGWVKFENQEQVQLNTTDSEDFVCDDSKFIKECRADDGTLILRVKND